MKRKKRILFFIQLPPPVHGVSITNKLVFNSGIINKGYEKKLVRINFSTEIAELRQFSKKKLWIFFITGIKLKWALIYFRPDIVYFSLIPVGSGFIRDAIFALTIKIFNRKVIFHLNNRGIPEYNSRIVFRTLYKWVFKNSTIIHVSKGLLQKEFKPLNLKNANTFVVGNTIEPFNISEEKQPGKIIHLLFLSNYFQEKGLMILLEAIVLLRTKIQNFKLDAYGAIRCNEEDHRCRDFIINNELDDFVEINGPVFGEEKHKVFEKADIFVFPSYFKEECFPLSILEAMNAKLPIIATRIGAIPEMIEDGVGGFLVDPLDPGQLAQKIESLVNNVALRQKIGQNAYLRFKRKYSYPVFEKKMSTVFETVLIRK